LTTDQGAQEILALGDVPSVLVHGKKKFPVGRYLKTKIREYYGFPERRSLRGTKNNTPEGAMLRVCAEKRVEFEKLGPKGVQEKRKQQVLNMETKHKIFSKKGHL